MFIRRKKYPSGNIGVIVVEKFKGKMKELCTTGIATNESELPDLIKEAKEWMRQHKLSTQPELDLYGEEREALEKEQEEVERVLSQVSNILVNGTDLILIEYLTE